MLKDMLSHLPGILSSLETETAHTHTQARTHTQRDRERARARERDVFVTMPTNISGQRHGDTYTPTLPHTHPQMLKDMLSHLPGILSALETETAHGYKPAFPLYSNFTMQVCDCVRV